MGLFDLFQRKPVAPASTEDLGVSLKAKPPAQHATWADRLDYACEKYNARYEIKRNREKSDEVIVRLVLDNGDTIISGRGNSTAAAVERAITNMETLR